MQDISNIKSLLAYKYAEEVNEICQPLFEKFGLTYFDYCLFQNNGSGFILISSRKWLEYFFKCKFKIGSTLCDSGIHLWSTYMDVKMVKDARNYFNQDYGLSIYKKHEEYIEYYDIATYQSNHKIIDFYFNNLDLLEQFFNYFKFKAQDIITHSSKQKLIIPQDMRGELNSNRADERQAFLELIKHKKYYVDVEDPNKYLTKRESETLKYFAKGYTMKEIGKVMHISPRTVEDYLTNIRQKFAVKNRRELARVLSLLEISYY